MEVGYTRGMPRIIAHVDMDAFFASVEERDHSWMKGLPIVVGADPLDGHSRGVVSTANYQARTYGIHSAMPIKTAWRLAETARKRGMPRTIFVTPSIGRYIDTSSRIMRILRAHADDMEEASIDEAYLDLSSSGTYTKAVARAKKIQQVIERDEHLTASVGIGPNKLIAKIASDRKKPNGLTVVPSEFTTAFLGPLSVRVIPGIGPKAERTLGMMGVYTIEDLIKIQPNVLEGKFGKRGSDIYQKARGIDDRILEKLHVARSVGEQETFHADTSDPEVILNAIDRLTQDVFRRMRREGFSTFKTVTVTVRFGDFETISRTHTLRVASGDPAILLREAIRLMLPFLDTRGNPHGKKVRLIGVRTETLGEG